MLDIGLRHFIALLLSLYYVGYTLHKIIVFMNHSKSLGNYLNIIKKIFLNIFRELDFRYLISKYIIRYIKMNHLRHQNYNNKHTEMEYLSNIQKNMILKVKNSFLKQEKISKN